MAHSTPLCTSLPLLGASNLTPPWGASGSVPVEMDGSSSLSLRVLWRGSWFKIGGLSLILGAASCSCDLV